MSSFVLLSLAALAVGSQAAVPACTAGAAAPIHCLQGYTYTNVPQSGGTCFCVDGSLTTVGQLAASSSAMCTQTACVSNGFTSTTSANFLNNTAILAAWAPSGCNNLTSVLFPAGANCLVDTFVCKGVKMSWSSLAGDGTTVMVYDCPPSFAGATYTGFDIVGTVANPTIGLASCNARLANFSASYAILSGKTCSTDSCNTAALLVASSSTIIKPAAGLFLAGILAMYL